MPRKVILPEPKFRIGQKVYAVLLHQDEPELEEVCPVCQCCDMEVRGQHRYRVYLAGTVIGVEIKVLKRGTFLHYLIEASPEREDIVDHLVKKSRVVDYVEGDLFPTIKAARERAHRMMRDANKEVDEDNASRRRTVERRLKEYREKLVKEILQELRTGQRKV